MTRSACVSARTSLNGAASRVLMFLPRRPPTDSHSMGMPAAGTMRASRPRFVPSQITSIDFSRSMRASASAGKTWPPVPPAMTRMGRGAVGLGGMRLPPEVPVDAPVGTPPGLEPAAGDRPLEDEGCPPCAAAVPPGIGLDALLGPCAFTPDPPLRRPACLSAQAACGREPLGRLTRFAVAAPSPSRAFRAWLRDRPAAAGQPTPETR